MAGWEFNADAGEIPGIIKTLEKAVSGYRMDPQVRAKTLLAVEESAVRLIEHSRDNSRLRLTVRKTLGNVVISLTAAGEAFPFAPDTPDFSLEEELSDSDTERFIRNVLLKSYAGDIRSTDLSRPITFPDSKGRTFYAIPDGSYLLIDGGREELRGEAYKISDGTMVKISSDGEIVAL
ncbi:MAG: hypothetical protein IJ088_10495 [Clostridia bacterium]|nr:hypothetical protein [Clostridia bacterium]